MEARFLIVGDAAISVEFGDDISIDTNRKVTEFNRELSANPVAGIYETIPTYRSLMIHYRPEIIGFSDLVRACEALLDRPGARPAEASRATIQEIPVIYGGEYGMDIEEVARFHNKTPQEIIDIHASHPSLVYMFGFLPGLGYTGSDNGFVIPRRLSPRLKVEGGSVVIWRNQTIILPNDTPTGWSVIGRTPVRMFDVNAPDPCLLKVGRWVRFTPVTQAEYDEIESQVEAGVYKCRICDWEAQ